MFEKVNPMHPDKIADRIAGALVDLAYTKKDNPKIAVEILVGHNACDCIVETDCEISADEFREIAKRICPDIKGYSFRLVEQDSHLANNQKESVKCGDNGIFKGAPVTEEQRKLTAIAKSIYDTYQSDGKYILDENSNKLILCQSCSDENIYIDYPNAIINPLGDWTGGINVDTGAVNRKLGSDMGDSVTGGGLHGKDLSKADVSVNIYAWLKAQETQSEQSFCCAIGDVEVDGIPYEEIVNIARHFIFDEIGGFEKFAEWGLIR